MCIEKKDREDAKKERMNNWKCPFFCYLVGKGIFHFEIFSIRYRVLSEPLILTELCMVKYLSKHIPIDVTSLWE